MRKHPIQKFICLTFLYAAVIIGIFVLQFKTESVFSRSVGGFHVSLAQNQTETHETQLKNQFQIRFGGLTFSANENTPIIVSNSEENSNTQALILDSWQESPHSVQFTFTDGTTLQFAEIEGEDGSVQYSVSATLQNEEESIFLPFKIAQGYDVQAETPGRIILSEKDSLFAFTAPRFDQNRLVLSALSPIAQYTPYKPVASFEFSAVQGLPLTDAETYSQSIKQFRSALVTKFNQNQRANAESITEKQIMAYVAEMAANGRYTQGLEAVSSYKRNNRRTYLSSPYFGSLVAMDKTLGVEMEKDEAMVRSAVSQLNLDIFTVSDITRFILREKKKPLVANVMAFPAAMEDFSPTVRQAAGIISVYAQVQKSDAALVSPLKPLLEPCVEILAHNAKLEDNILTLSEKDEPLSREQSIRAGQALFLLGTILSRGDFVDAGRLLVSENLTQEALSELSLQTLSDLYPLLASDNTFYPHQEILGYYGTNAVWAWTCAPSITYQIRSDSSILISTDFIQDAIHHTIFKNIPVFRASGEHTTGIVIQGMNYRSAADFEDWNAFGYVYQAEINTLYLKSRHKTKIEQIELYCDPPRNFSAN